MNTFDLATLQKNHPEAYNALEDGYKNDSCLEFFLCDGFVFARAKEDQRDAIGDDEYIFWEGVWSERCLT